MTFEKTFQQVIIEKRVPPRIATLSESNAVLHEFLRDINFAY